MYVYIYIYISYVCIYVCMCKHSTRSALTFSKCTCDRLRFETNHRHIMHTQRLYVNMIDSTVTRAPIVLYVYTSTLNTRRSVPSLYTLCILCLCIVRVSAYCARQPGCGFFLASRVCAGRAPTSPHSLPRSRARRSQITDKGRALSIDDAIRVLEIQN